MTGSQQLPGRSNNGELSPVVTPIGDAPLKEGKGPSGASEAAVWLQVSWSSHGTGSSERLRLSVKGTHVS